jgi:hypothetical protein
MTIVPGIGAIDFLPATGATKQDELLLMKQLTPGLIVFLQWKSGDFGFQDTFD